MPIPATAALMAASAAEDAWNARDPANVVLAYTTDSRSGGSATNFCKAAKP